MHFSTDQQTIDDLGIFGKPGANSVFNIYNKTYTGGGAIQLEEMFRYPLAEVDKINQRSQLIQEIVKQKIDFPFTASLFPVIERYLENIDERSKLNYRENGITDRLKSMVSLDPHEKNITTGVKAVKKLLEEIDLFIKKMSLGDIHLGYESDYAIQPGGNQSQELQLEVFKISKPFLDADFRSLMSLPAKNKWTYEEIVDNDVLLRFKKRDKIESSLKAIYHLDALLSVGKVARENNFCFPVATSAFEGTVSIKEVFHPMVSNAVANSIHIDPSQNIVFLTGANMAGKSTLMKSLGIALYTAHIGFPVAASAMTFSIREGMYTSINLPDNLGKGISHFYAEVLRVKKVATELGRNKQLFIIIDELFRGTNVKDAYEATVALTSAFAKRTNCMFVVSTHIMEAGNALQAICDNIQYVYLPTQMSGNNPVYTYRLKKGITDDRHGMIIVKNEGILDLLNQHPKSERI